MAKSEVLDRPYLFHGGKLLDPRCEALVDGVQVLVAGGLVKEVNGWRGALAKEGYYRRTRRGFLSGRCLWPVYSNSPPRSRSFLLTAAKPNFRRLDQLSIGRGGLRGLALRK